MNEPRRLREECESPLERELLHAGVSYRSPRGTRERTLAALGLVGSAALSAAAASSFTKVGWAKALAVASAVSAATAVPVAYYAWQHSQGQGRGAAVAPVAPKLALPSTAVRKVPPQEWVPPLEPLRVEPSAAVSASSVRVPRATAPNAELAVELAALEKARAALAAGDSSGALSQLAAYERSYPRGRLALEAEVLSIDALARSGQRDSARKRAEQFVRRHPKSVLNARVRGYLGR